jgi:ribosomal protein L40E
MLCEKCGANLGPDGTGAYIIVEDGLITELVCKECGEPIPLNDETTE